MCQLVSLSATLNLGNFFHSAAEGPDSLVEELDLVRKMNTAVMEERYEDAGM